MHGISFFSETSRSIRSGGDPLFEGLDAAFPTGWTGIVGANGTGKTTLLKLAAGILRPSGGIIRRPGTVGLCEQRTDEAPDGLDDILRLPDGHAAELCGRLALGEDWPARWRTLSHGERKRAQIAVALYREDPVVCLDEPTNRVDGGVRTLLAGALARYREIGLLVSHDRGLLDELCARCLFLDPPRAVLRPGGWSQGREQQQQEGGARRRAALARADVRRVVERVAEVRLEAARSRLTPGCQSAASPGTTRTPRAGSTWHVSPERTRSRDGSCGGWSRTSSGSHGKPPIYSPHVRVSSGCGSRRSHPAATRCSTSPGRIPAARRNPPA